MSDLLLILFSTALINNIIVEQVIGADPALSFSRKLDIAIGLAYTMIVLLPLVTVGTWLIDKFLLVPFDLHFLRLLVFVCVILLLAQCLKLWVHKVSVKLANRINIFLPIASINAAVLGTVLLNQQSSFGLFSSLVFGLGSGFGFAIILLMLTAINERLEVAEIPAPFRGMSITLITLGLISMAFMGLTGLTNI